MKNPVRLNAERLEVVGRLVVGRRQWFDARRTKAITVIDGCRPCGGRETAFHKRIMVRHLCTALFPLEHLYGSRLRAVDGGDIGLLTSSLPIRSQQQGLKRRNRGTATTRTTHGQFPRVQTTRRRFLRVPYLFNSRVTERCSLSPELIFRYRFRRDEELIWNKKGCLW